MRLLTALTGILLTGCALTPPAITVPYFVCYGGKDWEGEHVMVCSPVTEEHIKEHFKAPYLPADAR